MRREVKFKVKETKKTKFETKKTSVGLLRVWQGVYRESIGNRKIEIEEETQVEQTC